jgi:hypothetical protein
VPAAFTATPMGEIPTGTVATMVLVAPSITETLFEPEFATYANGAAIATEAAVSENPRPMRIPETTLIPENPLWIRYLVFMADRQCSVDAKGGEAKWVQGIGAEPAESPSQNGRTEWQQLTNFVSRRIPETLVPVAVRDPSGESETL